MNSEPVQRQSSVTSRKALFSFALFVFGVFFLGSLLSALFLNVLSHCADFSGIAVDLLDEAGRVIRRVYSLVALILFFPMIKSAGWRGWGDCGWQAPSRKEARREWGRGALFGLAVFLVLALVHILLPARHWDSGVRWGAAPFKIIEYLFAAVLIGLLEETFSRGILFRVLGRSWKWWVAAGITSIIFAHAHFIDPLVATIADTPIGCLWMSILKQSILSVPFTTEAGFVFLNLFLLGVLLCRVVQWRGSVWMAAGFHAGCVWVMKMNGLFSDQSLSGDIWWMSQRSDLTDGVFTSFILILLTVLAGSRLYKEKGCA